MSADSQAPNLDIALAHKSAIIVNALGPPPQHMIDRVKEEGRLIGALAFHSRYLNENVTSNNIASSSLCDVMPKSKYALDEQSGARRCSNLILSGARR